MRIGGLLQEFEREWLLGGVQERGLEGLRFEISDVGGVVGPALPRGASEGWWMARQAQRMIAKSARAHERTAMTPHRTGAG